MFLIDFLIRPPYVEGLMFYSCTFSPDLRSSRPRSGRPPRSTVGATLFFSVYTSRPSLL